MSGRLPVVASRFVFPSYVGVSQCTAMNKRVTLFGRVKILVKTDCQRRPWLEKMHFGSDSITYSGGQATEGQGGYYGSGGARAQVSEADDTTSTGVHRKKMIALAHDVELIRSTMIELENLEGSVRDKMGAGVSSTDKEVMELKHSIKKLMTTPAVLESLNNLEINGEPVWGLSSAERELIILARAKVNEC